MTEQRICRTVLLSDEPSAVDAFGGSHEKVANAIVEMISSEDGGKSIGLEGEWGSGKSTVISLVRNKLQNNTNNNNIVYLFDAWAHEADPLRKVFLEQLLNFLKKKEWITQDKQINKWDNAWNEFIGLKTETKTENNPVITKLGLSVFIGSILVPFGIALLNNGLRNEATYNLFAGKEYIFSWDLLFGTLFSLAPLLIPVVIVIIKKIQNTDKDFKFNFAIFAQKYDTKTTTLSTRTPNPTSVEFEKFFTKLINEILGENNRKLIIVIDNLDRIAPMEATSILSTLQTFLNCESKIDDSCLHRLWILIPYDKNGLSRLWNSETENNSEENDKEHYLAFSMISKRFQIRFRVPPIVLSNWEKYFKNQLRIAFPEHCNEREFYQTYNVYYEFLRETKSIPPTPREMKIFINQIGTLHRQWGDNIPLYDMAYFVCKEQEKGKKFQEYLLLGNYASGPIVQYLSDNLAENFSSLWFNLEPKLAMQALLSLPMNNYIMENQIIKLNELAKKHQIGFWTVLNKLPYTKWANDNPNCLGTVAYFIDQYPNTSENEFPDKNSFITSFSEHCFNVKEWNLLADNMKIGIKSIFSIIEDCEISKSIIQNIIIKEFYKIKKNDDSSIVQPKEIDTIQDEIKEIIETIIDFFSVLNNGIFEELSEKPIFIDVDRYVILGLYTELGKTNANKKYKKLFTFSEEIEYVFDAMAILISNTLYSPVYLETTKLLLQHAPPIESTKLKESINSFIVGDNTKFIAELLETMWLLDTKNSQIIENSVLLSLINSGDIANQIILNNNAKNYKASSWCIFLLIKHYVEPRPQQKGQSPNGYAFLNTFLSSPINGDHSQILENIIDIIKNYSDLEFIIKLHSENPTSTPFCKEIILHFSNKQLLDKFLSHSFTYSNWVELNQIVGETDFQKIISNINNIDNLIVDVETDFSEKNAPLYRAIYNSGLSDNQSLSFTQWLSFSLKNLTKDQWATEFSNESDLIGLLIDITNDEKEFLLPIAFSQAFVEFSNKILNKQSIPEKFAHDINKLLNCIENQTTPTSQILDHLVDHQDAEIPSLFFTIYGNLINNPEMILVNNNIIRTVFIKIISTRSVAGTQWLVNVLSSTPDLLKTHPNKSDADYFIKLLMEEITQENATDFATELQNILNILGLEIAITDEQEENQVE